MQGLLQAFVVQVDQCHEPLLMFVDNGFADVLELIDHGLDLFRIDILSAGAEDHVLQATLDEDIPIVVDHTEVTGGKFRIYSTLWFASARELLDTAKLQWLDAMLVQLARMQAALWIVVDANDQSPATLTAAVTTLKTVAARCKAQGVQMVIYPHGGCAIDCAEGALAVLPRIGDPDVKISIHLCHELMKGNRDRMPQVVSNVASYLALASVNGADYDAQDHPNDNWASAIKPLDQGNYDPRPFLQAMATAGYSGPIELHTYNLPDPRVDDHFGRSLGRWQQWVAANPGGL